MNKNKMSHKRWLIAIAGTLLQLCLGTVYAWSYFQNLLMNSFGWSNIQVAWVFSLAICSLGLAAAWGGANLARVGPRMLAMTGGALFSIGYLLAACALHLKSLTLLYLGFGLLGGTGLGLGYVTPVATVAKWFPDKKGLATGMVIMGFGFGALLMSKVLAPWLMSVTQGNLVTVFFLLGLGFAVTTISAGSLMQNPPADFVIETVPLKAHSVGASTADNGAESVHQCLTSHQFVGMWTMFFCNITAGIMIIGFQSPLLQQLLKQRSPEITAANLIAQGGTLIALSSLFNGIGRMFWGGLSDHVGRIQVFRLMLATQIAAFIVLANTSHPVLFTVLVCYILLCYGGGFGSMPSFVMDVFGARLMPIVYGIILTAWSLAGVVGPQVIAWLRDHYPKNASTLAFSMGAAFLFIGLLLSLVVSYHPLTSQDHAVKTVINN